MNAVEIEEAVSALAERAFDGAEFPYQFLEAFGNKEATIKRLRVGATNKSDLGGVLQTGNIHIAIAALGEVTKTLAALKASPATTKAKAKFVLATDGDTLEAEDMESGETVACAYTDFPNKFGFFLSLAGISTVKQVRDSSFDIRATSRLNRLYVELLKDNPEWDTAARRPDMNHFMARLIFCFFAEDTDIFSGTGLFTETVEKMSARDSSNTHEVIGELFRAMNTRKEDHEAANIRNWARGFPYVNGGLFSGNSDVPRFNKISRSYLIHIGNLDWQKINPDIFGSMIQAVADDDERGALGMHYTSVPNILKVLNPLFLDDLRAKLAEADDNSRKLLNLRNRMARSLLMEQVLAPRFEFKPKKPNEGPTPGFNYGPEGYDPNGCNVGFNEATGQFQIEIKGLAEPKTKEAARICREDLNEVIATFVQDKTALERGLFDQELVPEELTQLRLGKIIKDKYPELDDEDQEAVRQHAIAALNLTQKAKEAALGGSDGDGEKSPNTAFVEGVRKYAMDVRELDIDLIDRINPFGEAYAILAKAMSEESLKQVAAAIAGKRVTLTIEEARDLAKRALKFKQERGRLPSITSPDAWEKRMAEGIAFLARMKAEAARG